MSTKRPWTIVLGTKLHSIFEAAVLSALLMMVVSCRSTDCRSNQPVNGSEGPPLIARRLADQSPPVDTLPDAPTVIEVTFEAQSEMHLPRKHVVVRADGWISRTVDDHGHPTTSVGKLPPSVVCALLGHAEFVEFQSFEPAVEPNDRGASYSLRVHAKEVRVPAFSLRMDVQAGVVDCAYLFRLAEIQDLARRVFDFAWVALDAH